MSEFNALTIAQIIAALRAENDALRAKLKAPHCACDWDAEDDVTGLCGAHAAYFADWSEDEIETKLREFAGWLSGDIPELHSVEVPKLAESLVRFLDASRRASASAPVAHSKSQRKRFAAMDRPCTCPPNERPWPCTGQYALHECRRVAREQSVGNLRPGPPTEAVK